jgi:RNA polymerase sigma-70 factor (ECF subfamily)
LFNEGYKASQGETLVRKDLCQEAIRLLDLLVQHPVGDQPQAHALLALMLFNAARLDARVSEEGRLLLLVDQDRTCWDRRLIALGVTHLVRSGMGDVLTEFHFEAGIAACHVTATTHGATNWARILELYDGLLRLKPSPVVALNRAVAVARVHGPRAGLKALEPLERDPALVGYYLLPAVRGHLLELSGDVGVAVESYGEALERTLVRSEREYLEGRLRELSV